MIIIVEGPSAAGKSTWASQFAPSTIAETDPTKVPRGLNVEATAQFWCDLNGRRWRQAVRVEAAFGTAVCDTDPLKVHYAYCLARVGAGSWAAFTAGMGACRGAIEAETLGIGDLIICHVPDDITLEDQRRSDPARRRHYFDLHRRLSAPLREWYDALDHVDSGRVMWSLPSELPNGPPRSRYDLDLFDTWMHSLPADASD